MTRTTGVPLVAPFGRADRIHDALPQNVQDLVDQSAAVDHSVVRSDGGIFHHGSLRAIADSIDEIRTEFNIGTGQLSLEEIGDSDLNRERLGTVTAIEGRALAGEQLGSLSLFSRAPEPTSRVTVPDLPLRSLSPISPRLFWPRALPQVHLFGQL